MGELISAKGLRELQEASAQKDDTQLLEIAERLKEVAFKPEAEYIEISELNKINETKLSMKGYKVTRYYDQREGDWIRISW